MTNKRQILIGLPSSGKTTFLAALWHVVESNEIEDSLRLVKLVGDREYFDGIRDSWLACKPLERTAIDQPTISMLLGSGNDEESIEVYLPDIAGEKFENMFGDRHWSKEVDDYLAQLDGLLIFVHPLEVKEPVPIIQVDRVMGAQPEIFNEVAKEWHALMACTQVKLVDLVQFVVFRRSQGRELISPLKAAIVVSAWDLVEAIHAKQNPKASPREWIADRLPLLDQYLKANPDLIESRTFGVSAQGGDIGSSPDQLLSKQKPSDRILVKTDEHLSHDISLPLRWLMNMPSGK